MHLIGCVLLSLCEQNVFIHDRVGTIDHSSRYVNKSKVHAQKNGTSTCCFYSKSDYLLTCVCVFFCAGKRSITYIALIVPVCASPIHRHYYNAII